MLDWSFALCPRSGSHFTMRFYEACALGRYPVVLGDNLWLDNDAVLAYTIFSEAGENEIAAALLNISRLPLDSAAELGKNAQDYFYNHVKPYFSDPTRAFIVWLRQRRIID